MGGMIGGGCVSIFLTARLVISDCFQARVGNPCSPGAQDKASENESFGDKVGNDER